MISNIYPSLRQKRVFITGGASGIGACLVGHFLRQGARVAMIDIDRDAMQRFAVELADQSLQPSWTDRVDVTDIAALQAAIGRAAQSLDGGLDVLINNAANDQRVPFEQVTPEGWDQAMAINLRPHFFAAQAAAPLMPPGSSLINMGSVSWRRRRTGFTGYTTAKGGIHALTRTLAQELGPRGIRVNSVVPGAIKTERQTALWADEAAEREFLATQALKIRLLPDDVAAMTLFLASDDSRGCAGQDFLVDGGIV